jgi:hypothetical protein
MAPDIKGGTPADWLVCGWFTPDYRPLAEAFAARLAKHGAPYHLWAKPALDGWNTSRKPSVVMEALDAYPDTTVVLMDVDCIIQGDPRPVAEVAGDVGICVIARDVRARRKIRHWLAVETSSRVIVFQPTDGARRFAKRWADEIARSNAHNDEHSLSWAYLRSPDVRFDYIAQAYSGREISMCPDAVIAHDSAHERRKRSERGGLQAWLRNIERPFRSGRTAAQKLQGVLVSANGKHGDAA